MKTEYIFFAVLTVLVLVSVFVFLNLNKSSEAKDIFNGRLTNIELSPQILTGRGVYDRSCAAMGNGLTNCDAGIQTEKGILNFNYKHDMAVQPCIAEGDELEVEIVDREGNAKVKRLK